MSIGGAVGVVSSDGDGLSASLLLLRRLLRWTRVVVCETCGGLMHLLILITITKHPPQQSIVRRSDVMALMKICGRLFVTVGSSLTVWSAVEV